MRIRNWLAILIFALSALTWVNVAQAANPTISSLSPATGAVGATVTITGTNFGSSQGTSTVKFNGTTATATSWGTTSIVVTVPTGATSGNVVVTVSNHASNGSAFTVVPAPSISSLSITTGAVGAAVTVSGSNFGSSQGSGTVKFNGTTATVTTWSATSIAVTVPSGATNGNVVVNASGVASNGSSFTVVPAPSITSLSISSGAVGAAVTITGTSFGSSQGTGTVTFNGTSASVTSWSATSIAVTVPSAATTGNVVVNASGVASNGKSFTVSPGITSLSITSGAVGAAVTITGTTFGTTGTVTFNGTTATSTSWTSTSIAVTVPSGATTGNVVVTVGGVASNGKPFTVAPGITSLSVTTGAVGAAVTITGTTFGSSGTVTFNGTAATSTSWTSTSIAVTVPSGATTGNVVVTVGGVASNGVSFTVVSAPSITSLSVATGAVGAAVTITGTSFGSSQGSGTVTFNGTSASVTSWNATSIAVTVPSGATTGNVVVNADGVASSGSSFTVVAAPSISSLSLTSGPVGAPVTITGTNFGSTQGTGSVTFNGTTATPTSWSATSIAVTVPSSATTGNVVVNASGVASNGINFTLSTLPLGWQDQDVGSVNPAGNASYSNGVFTVQGSGNGFGNGSTADSFNFAYQALSGDGTIVARIASSNGGQAGVMLRETLTAGSTTAFMSSYGASVFYYRTTTGVGMGSASGSGSVPYWYKVTRSGNVFTAYVAPDGVNFVKVGASQTINMAQSIYVGLGVSSTNPGGLSTATFDSVSVNSNANPAPVITSVSATTGSIGSQVVITGQNFGTTQGNSTVLLHGAATTVNSWSASSITITIPSGASSGYLLVSVAPGMNDSNAINFSITSNPLPSGWLDQDVGAVGLAGSATYSNGVFTVQGAGLGYEGGLTADSFHFVYQSLTGNGTVVVRVASVSNQFAYAGVVIRDSLDTSDTALFMSSYASADWQYYRTTSGSASAYASATGSVPYWYMVTRNGSQFTGYVSPDGINWLQVGASQTINMAQTVYLGFGVSSGSTGSLYTATFDSVSSSSIANPAPVISSLSATEGPIGTQVVITGQNFGTTQGTSTVLLHGAAVTINSWSATSITITIPTGATSGDLIVSVAPSMNNSNPVEFTITTNPPPSGWLDQDVGYVGQLGSSTYTSGVFTVIGGGNGNGGGDNTQDGYHFDYRVLSGDGTIIARIASVNNNGWPGVMMRETLVSGAKSIFLRGYISPILQSRNVANGSISQVSGPNVTWNWVKIVRTGNDFVGYVSPDGVNWTVVGGSVPISMAGTIYVGVAVTSDYIGTLSTATFDNVSLSTSTNPAPVITSLSATTGPVGTQVIITGTGFGASQGTSTVTLNNSPVTIGLWSATSISVTIPGGATSGNMIVLLSPSMDSSNPVVFSVTSSPIPSGWFDQDIGLVWQRGSATYSSGVFTINGAGPSTSGYADGLHFVYQPIASDFTIIARVTSLNTNARGGVMVRQTLDPNSTDATAYVYAYGNPPDIDEFDYRNLYGIPVTSTTVGSSALGWVKLTRSVNAFSGFSSPDGVNWTQIGATQTIPTTSTVYVGLVGTAGGSGIGTATIDNVSLMLGSAEPNPTITGLSPLSGGPGSVVTFSGSGFGATQGTSTVNFNGVAATAITSWSDTQILAAVPDGATTGPVSVVVGNITGNGPTFVVAFPATITDSLGHQTTFNSGLFGGQWSFTNAQGSGCSSCTVRGNTQNQYDNKGHLLWTIDALGHEVVYQSDGSGNVISQEAAGDSNTPNSTTNYTYNNFGEPLTVTDALGNVTTNVYDTHGNLTSVTTPKPNGSTAASVTQFGYNTLGQLTTITDPLNHVTTLTYTPVGLIWTITDFQNNVTTYGYDSHGNRTSVLDALNHQTTFGYDAGDRLTLITYPDTTTTQFGYDYRGRRTSVTDQNGKITTYAYDDADRLTTVTDASTPPNVTTYAYDTENNLTSITDANNHQTIFAYDAYGRVQQTNFPSSQIETYGYDADNNLISKTDRNNHTIQYVYDVLNRLTRKIYPDSTEADYVYDLVGKIQQVNDPTGTYAFAYDNMGRLTGTTTNYTFLTTKTFTNAYTYDAASNRTGFTDPESGSTTYAYDTLNRLQTLTPPAAISGGSFGFSYDALSRRTQMTRPNNVATNYGYDNLSRLLSVLHQVSASTIDGASYTVDSAGNRTAKTDQRLALTTNYGYDPIYQLLSATQGSTTTESYTYDPVGNRLSSLGVASYSNNTSNELTSTSNASYTYDLNGNTLTKAVGSNTTTYAWDYENRLTSVTLPSGGGTVSFKYDPFGRRIYKSSSTATSVYAYDGDNLIEETNASGAVVARYSQGLNIDEPLAMLRSSATSFYHVDGLGTVTSLSNGSGALAQTYTFDSFGKQTAASGSLTNPFQYTGRESDSETGLYYYRARYYDPSTGRFLSEDPIRFKGGTVNFYPYVDDDPTTQSDPSGLRAQVCCRPLRGKWGHRSGKNHCYVLINPDDNPWTFHTYGLHREDGNDVKYPGGARPVLDDPTDIGGTCSDVKDATACKEKDFVKKALSNTDCPSCGNRYWFTTTNSNYWVWDALTKAGMTPPDFMGGGGLLSKAPGYGDMSKAPE
jgi:RHS repeat-associated protein